MRSTFSHPYFRTMTLVTLFGLGNVARAEPPWTVDDPGVTPHRMITFYDSYQMTRGEGERLVSWPSLAVTYGVTPRLEVGLEWFYFTTHAEQDRQRGFNDLGFALKYLLEGTEEEPRLAVAYQIDVPSGSSGFRSRVPAHSLWLTGQSGDTERARLTWNVGARTGGEDGLNSLFYGIVVDRQVGPRTLLGIELYGNTPEVRGDRHEIAGSLGIIHDISDTLKFQGKFGRSFNGNADLVLYVGMTFDVFTGRE